MSRVWSILGTLWAAPVTLLGLIYVLPLWATGCYEFVGRHDQALVWQLKKSSPGWLRRLWRHWAGHTIGNLVVLRSPPEESRFTQIVLAHELVHVRQCMTLGVFQPLAYAMIWGIIRLMTLAHGKGQVDAYYDNPFEIHARRSVGQIVDIVGLTQKLQGSKTSKN